MRAKEFITEYKSETAIAAILNKYGDTLQDKLTQDLQIPQNKQYANATPKTLIDLIIQVDPTKNSAYTDWIIRKYLDGNFRYIEDLGKLTELLTFYEKAKPKLPQEQRDINKFKSYQELDQFIDKLQAANTDTRTNRETERQYGDDLIKSGQVEIYYNSPEIKIVIPKTREASCYFGKNTKWCTAATKNNKFDQYNSKDNLYILLFKKENIRWQFHFQSMQFMDEKDQDLTAAQVKSVGYLFPGTFIHPDASEQVQLAAIQQHGAAIGYIKNPSKQAQLAAIQQNGTAIYHIKNPSEQVQLTAVQQNGRAIEYIKNPSEQIQLAAVQQNGYAIKYIENPSEQVQLTAIQQNGTAISYIKNSNEQIQLAAVQQNGNAIEYIKNPSEQIQLAAVQQNGYAIFYIKNPSEELQLAAVQKDGTAIGYIKNPSEQVQLAAVKQNGTAIRYIKNSNEQVQLAAVQQNGNAIYYIKNPSEQVQLAAVQQNGRAIKYIENPSEQVQLTAVKRHGSAIKYIENPSEQVQLAAKRNK